MLMKHKRSIQRLNTYFLDSEFSNFGHKYKIQRVPRHMTTKNNCFLQDRLIMIIRLDSRGHLIYQIFSLASSGTVSLISTGLLSFSPLQYPREAD